ncbi:TetR family transcriptional regulator, partial [Micromonospora aurantiaca]|nr:TetR family transcriptional regulator [Micromonospora aurantiaca]
MAVRETRAERRERTREELVMSAMRLFAERGVAATSVEAIAETAGYSRGAYHS